MTTTKDKDAASISKGEEDYAKALIDSYVGGLTDAVKFLDNYVKSLDKDKMFREYISMSNMQTKETNE